MPGGHSKGFRSRTRKLLSRKPRERGKTGISKILHDYKRGEKVVVNINPSVHKGMPHRRFHGRVGSILARRGTAYVLQITQGNAVKEIIVRPEHLAPHTER